MYVSPINIVVGEMQTYYEQENEKMILNAVNEITVDVDKDELMKALRYDRDQYNKGYKDGQHDILEEIRKELTDMGELESVVNGKTEYINGVNYCLDLISEMLTERQEG